MPWKPCGHISTVPALERKRERTCGVQLGKDLKEVKINFFFCLEKKIAISLRKARLMCYEKVPGRLSALPNLKSSCVYRLAFQRAAANSDRLITQDSAETFFFCFLSSAFQTTKCMAWEMLTHHVSVSLQSQIFSLKKPLKQQNHKKKKLITTKHWAFNRVHWPLKWGPCLSTRIHHCHCTASSVLLREPGSWVSWLSIKRHNCKHAQQAAAESVPFYAIKTSFAFRMSL